MGKIQKFIKPAFLTTLFIVFFLLATRPIIEGDAFWHIKTGEWIWQNKELLSQDPFSYTTQSFDPMRPNAVRYEVILKGYWLSQIIFYLVWAISGFQGIVFMRALMLVLILFTLYHWMKKRGVDFYLSIIFLCMAGYYMKDITDRPQNFSFLFFPIAGILLDHFSPSSSENAVENPPVKRFISFWWLPMLMLIWSNMHGGYITGVALIFIYMLSDGLHGLYKKIKTSETPASYIKFLLICAIAIIVTLLNPTTYKSFVLVFQQLQSGPKTVSEMMSPLQTVILYGDYKPTFWPAILITAVILLSRIKHILKPRYIAIIFFAAAALLVQRNITFFFCLLPLAAIEVNDLLKGRFKLIAAAAAIAMSLMIASVFSSDLKYHRIIRFEIAPGLYPEGAVNFMRAIRPTGNMFNLAEWGSYTLLTLPEYKVFDDGRRLMDDIEIAHISVLFPMPHTVMGGIPEWKAILNAFQVNIILIPSVSPFLGDFFPIVAALYTDNDFSLVYQDSVSLIYLRKGSGNDHIIWRFSTPKDLSLIQAIQIMSYTARSAKQKETNARIISELNQLMAESASVR